MRKKLIKLLVLLVPVSFFLAGCEKETILRDSDVPAEIQTYVSAYFPDQDIVQVVRDRDEFKVTFDVFLSGVVSLEFDKDYQVIDLSSSSGLPDNVIPGAILEFVQANYPQQIIVEWELNKKSQEIGLDNGLELHFSKEGEFLRIDDD